jgi:copper chaperone
MVGNFKLPFSLVNAEMIMVQFKVENMTCGGCAAAITRAIRALDAGAAVEIDRAARTVRVEPRTADAAALEAAIREAGYRAVLA